MPAAPKLGGFYQRDARDVEAQLLAQAMAARTGQPAAGQPALSQAPAVTALPQDSAYGRSVGQPEPTSMGRMSTAPGGSSHQGSRAQSPAVPSADQHAVPILDPPAQGPVQAGPWAAGTPLPSGAGALFAQPGQLQGGLPGWGLPQLPQPALWPNQATQLPQPALWPNQATQLGPQPGGQSLFPGALVNNTALSSSMLGMGMPDMSSAGQGLQSYPGYLGQYGASSAGKCTLSSLLLEALLPSVWLKQGCTLSCSASSVAL